MADKICGSCGQSIPAQGEAERGGEAVAWAVTSRRGGIETLHVTEDDATMEAARKQRFEDPIWVASRPFIVTPLYARSAGEGTPSVTAEDIAWLRRLYHSPMLDVFQRDSVNRILALLEGAQHTQTEGR
jgi:hypothetical protein